MFFAAAMYYERKGTFNPFAPYANVIRDEFTDKDIRNYQAYTDMTQPIIPSANNKIPEGKLWQLNQPAYMRECPEAKLGEISWMLAAPPSNWGGFWVLGSRDDATEACADTSSAIDSSSTSNVME